MVSSTPPEPLTPASAWLPERPFVPDALGPDPGPLQLAWLGDAVWELHQRLRHCQRAGRSRDLHRAVVGVVKAEAQAEALARLEPLLTDPERDWVRRGRNRAGRGPRRGEAAIYGQATGFETMLGWLFLRDPARLADLLDQLEVSPPFSPPTDHESPSRSPS